MGSGNSRELDDRSHFQDSSPHSGESYWGPLSVRSVVIAAAPVTYSVGKATGAALAASLSGISSPSIGVVVVTGGTCAAICALVAASNKNNHEKSD